VESFVTFLGQALTQVKSFADVQILIYFWLGFYLLKKIWDSWRSDDKEHKQELKSLNDAEIEQSAERLNDCEQNIEALNKRVRDAEAKLLVALRMQIKSQGIYESSIRGVGGILSTPNEDCNNCPLIRKLPALLEDEVAKVTEEIEKLAPEENK